MDAFTRYEKWKCLLGYLYFVFCMDLGGFSFEFQFFFPLYPVSCILKSQL